MAKNDSIKFWELHFFICSLSPNILIFLQIVVGDFGLSFEQSKAQFALWSILAAVSW